MEILFESHATSVDNEVKIASGTNDVALSELGRRQAAELGKRYQNSLPDVVYCSTLQRSYMTAEIAFYGTCLSIIQDARLNECNYGTYNGKQVVEVEALRQECILQPFLGGESYLETTAKMRSFLNEIASTQAGKRVMIIGHRATQYALEYLINRVDLEKAVTDSWKWQPGWCYVLCENNYF